MTIYGGTGVTTVESVRITPRPLLSPLPEGVLDQVDGDDLVAFGLDALQPDMPLPSARGRHLRDAIRALRQRPRMRFCRSGLWGVQDTGSPAWRTFPLRRHYAAADWSPSPAARAPWTAWAYVEPDALKTTQVVALVHEGVEGGHGFATDVPPDPAQAPVWVKLAPAPRPIADPLPFVGRFGGLVGFNVGSVSGQTTAGLLSATIWGPP
jgi:hypothetical protein